MLRLARFHRIGPGWTRSVIARIRVAIKRLPVCCDGFRLRDFNTQPPQLKPMRRPRSGSFSEDLHHGILLGLIDLGQGLLHQRAVFIVARVQHLIQAESGVASSISAFFSRLLLSATER